MPRMKLAHQSQIGRVSRSVIHFVDQRKRRGRTLATFPGEELWTCWRFPCSRNLQHAAGGGRVCAGADACAQTGDACAPAAPAPRAAGAGEARLSWVAWLRAWGGEVASAWAADPRLAKTRGAAGGADGARVVCVRWSDVSVRAGASEHVAPAGGVSLAAGEEAARAARTLE